MRTYMCISPIQRDVGVSIVLCWANWYYMKSTGSYARIALSCIHLSSKKKHVCYATNFLLLKISVNMSFNVVQATSHPHTKQLT